MKSFLYFAALAAAAPLAHQNQRRNIISSTVTEIVTDVVYTTTTVWVPSSSAGGFFETYPTDTAAAHNSPAAVQVSATTLATSTSTTLAAVVAATPAPVQAPPVNVPVAAPPASSSTAASSTPAQPPTGTSPAPAGANTGDITYYDVAVGLGSCGWQGTNDQNLVALSHLDMNNGVNPNLNAKCHQTINIYYGGQTHQATVYDTCPSCAAGSLDLTQTLFDKVAPNGDGRVHGVTWSFA